MEYRQWQKIIAFILNRLGRSIVREILIAMCANDSKVLNKIRLQRVILRLEKYVNELPFFYFFIFKCALFLFQYAIPPLSWKLRPFSSLALEKKISYMEEWQQSRFYHKRVLFKIIQSICVAHLYSEPRLLISIGYKNSMRHRLSVKRSNNAKVLP